MNSSNVSTGKPKTAGAIYRAPIGTVVPTDAESPLDTAFVELGYVSEDGVSNSNTAETSDVKAWGGAPVLNLLTGKPDNWTFKLIESLNTNVLKTVYGDANVTVDSQNPRKIHIRATSGTIPDAVYVIDMIMKDNALKRIVIPKGSLGEVAEVVYRDNEPVGYGITVKAMDMGGYTHDEYILLPEATAAAKEETTE